MIIKYTYSATKNAFYPLDIKKDYDVAGSWPEDGVEISDDDFNLYSGYPPEGKILLLTTKGCQHGQRRRRQRQQKNN